MSFQAEAKKSNKITSFDLIEATKISFLDLEVCQYRHEPTGAEHFHFTADTSENIFMACFHTPPFDNSGVFHILEHAIMCGSKNFPVSDLLFQMSRRSVSQFMNALTGSDWTGFAFATPLLQDFNNLLSVYLNSIFFPRLDPLDFAQEGHRLELQQIEDLHSDIHFQGVVLNEMIGAMSTPSSQLWELFKQHFLPNTPYQFNSGGEPNDIVNLSYEKFVATHQRFFTPSNVKFITFGNIPAAHHQNIFETQVLQHFDHSKKTCKPQNMHFGSAKQQLIKCKLDDNYFMLGWLLGETSNLNDQLEADLLFKALIENPFSPLNQLIQSNDLDPVYELCGIDRDGRELILSLAFRIKDSKSANELEDKFTKCITGVASHGLPKSFMEMAIKEIELERRKFDEYGVPYGVQLFLRSMPAMLKNQNPCGLLDIGGAITELNKKIGSPDYFKSLINRRLVNNNHHLSLTLVNDINQPSPSELLNETLDTLNRVLTIKQRQEIATQQKSLESRQTLAEDLTRLPMLRFEQIKSEAKSKDFRERVTQCSNTMINIVEMSSQGLVHQSAIMELSFLPSELQKHLKLYCFLLTDIGMEQAVENHIINQQSLGSTELNAKVICRQDSNNPQKGRLFLCVSGTSLQQDYHSLTQLLHYVLNSSKIDSLEDIQSRLSEFLASIESNLAFGAHMLALSSACAPFSYREHLAAQWHGFEAISRLKALTKDLENNAAELNQLFCDLKTIQSFIEEQSVQLIMQTGSESKIDVSELMAKVWKHSNLDSTLSSYGDGHLNRDANNNSEINGEIDGLIIRHSDEFYSNDEISTQRCWVANKHLNTCAMAIPTVSGLHADAAALTLAATLIHGGYLNQAIRERGGAYGVGVTQESQFSCFRLFSHDDPNLERTLMHFNRSLSWLLVHENFTDQDLEFAKLKAVSQLTAQTSSFAFHIERHLDLLLNETKNMTHVLIDNIASVSRQDVVDAVKRYLVNSTSNTVLLANQQSIHEAETLGFKIKEL